MTGYYPPLEAYRRDLARIPDRENFGDDDGDWIVLAHVVHRLADTADENRDTRLREFRESMRDDDAESTMLGRLLATAADSDDMRSAFVAGASSAAKQMEDAGALHLSASSLAALVKLTGNAVSEKHGRLVADWARIERQLGEFDVAADLYREAGRIGNILRSADLRARAHLGLGVLARIRGNYPEARIHFRGALTAAERAGLATLTGIAHQGLFITAAVARDFDAAFDHGWVALAHVAGDPAREVEVLVNLAQLCLDVGQNEAALNTALAAAGQTTVARSRIPALAIAATAAARVGDLAALERYTDAILPHLDDTARPYEVAQLLHSLFTAWTDAGRRDRAATFRKRGLVIARRHRFAELMHQFETAPAAVGVKPAVPLSEGAHRVVRALAELPASSGHGTR